MCQSVEPLEKKRFVETIRIENGKIDLLALHEARMNRTRKEVFGVNDWIDLTAYINPESYQERTKCRVEYDRQIIKVEYATYHMRPVHSLKLVVSDDIDYTYKSTDRSALVNTFDQRGNCDDVLIVRNGLLTDTSICNVALWNGREWITPKHPLLAGTMRAHLLQEGKIREAEIRLEDLEDYSQIRMFNALIDFGEQSCDLPHT